MNHRAVGQQPLLRGTGYLAHNGHGVLRQRVVAQHLEHLGQQPGGFNVVAVALNVAPAVPLVVEEEVEVVRLRVEQPAGEYVDERAQLLLKRGASPHAVQVGVGLQNVQVGVHGARTVLILVRQAHVAYGSPVVGQGLDVACVPAVESMALERVEQSYGAVERFSVARGTCQLAHAVDGEAYGIRLLLHVERPSLVVHRPVHAAALGVDEVFKHVLLGTQRSVSILLFAQHPVGRGKGPQDARIEHGTLLGPGVQHVVAVHATVEAAVFAVGHLVEPEAQYVVFKQLPRRLFPLCCRHFLMGYL